VDLASLKRQGDSKDLANIRWDVNFQEVIHSILLVWKNMATSFCVLPNQMMEMGEFNKTFQMTYFSLAF
jgi:hypothetical protein